MNLVFEPGSSAVVTVGQLADNTVPEGTPREFLYEGYVYGIVRNEEASCVRLDVSKPVNLDEKLIVVINLKSLTFRALPSSSAVIPVGVTVVVDAPITHRYNGGRPRDPAYQSRYGRHSR